jgi:hypothetical protein
LKHFQSGDGPKYVEHVRRSVELSAGRPDSLLLFAGGQSDSAAGPRSEGQGYWLIAEHADWYGYPNVRERSTTEEFSRDSLENLLFGICRFREYVGRYPEHVTAVGWIFKGRRFQFHAEALGLGLDQFDYEGVNNPEDLAKAEHFEQVRLEGFREDPYGSGAEPTVKKVDRNPFHRQHGYASSCPELRELLLHAGPGLYAGALPWRGSR